MLRPDCTGPHETDPLPNGPQAAVTSLLEYALWREGTASTFISAGDFGLLLSTIVPRLRAEGDFDDDAINALR